MEKYQLINYFDVWGNKKDGWEVNNLCKEGIIELKPGFNTKDIVKALKDAGFFKKHVRRNMLDIDDVNYDFIIEIFQRSNQKPVCRLELIR